MNTVFAVVTTYALEDSLVANVDRMISQVAHVVIVDDGGSAKNQSVLREWFGSNPNVTVLAMDANSGIAAALNRGVRYAKEHGADFVLTLDDDTLIAPGLVSALLRGAAEWERDGHKVGLIGPQWTHDALALASEPLADARVRPVRTLITSGCLMPLSAFEAAGGFREEFFIDSVDFDFCFRLQDAGLAVLQLVTVGMAHSLGEGAVRRICGVTMRSTNHSAIRRYYAMRNSLTLMKERAFKNPLFVIAGLAWWATTFVKIAIIEKHRRKKFLAIWLGAKHFWEKRYGKIAPDLAKKLSAAQ